MEEDRVHTAWVTQAGHAGASGAATSIFPWWSLSKTAIALCALRLAAFGRLSLDAAYDSRNFTLRQLLQHAAGLRNYGHLDAYHHDVERGAAPWSRTRLMQEADGETLAFAPGAGWAYSNIGYLLVRERIEQATGTSLAQALRATLFEPAGLASARLATVPGDFGDVHWPDARTYDPRWVFHGCVTGTAVDAARLVHVAAEGRLLSQEWREAMLRALPIGGAIPGRPWTSCGYALGLMSGRMGDAGRAIGHTGGGPGSVCAVYHFPDLEIPVTAAAFLSGADEGRVETAARDLARRAAGEHRPAQ